MENRTLLNAAPASTAGPDYSQISVDPTHVSPRKASNSGKMRCAVTDSSIHCDCSGSMIPDTNVGGNIATISEVSDDQETTNFYARVQTGSCLSGA